MDSATYLSSNVDQLAVRDVNILDIVERLITLLVQRNPRFEISLCFFRLHSIVVRIPRSYLHSNIGGDNDGIGAN